MDNLGKLSVGIQDFAKIRKEGYRYVDKTKQIFDFIQRGVYNFYNRPRRFTKVNPIR